MVPSDSGVRVYGKALIYCIMQIDVNSWTVRRGRVVFCCRGGRGGGKRPLVAPPAGHATICSGVKRFWGPVEYVDAAVAAAISPEFVGCVVSPFDDVGTDVLS